MIIGAVCIFRDSDLLCDIGIGFLICFWLLVVSYLGASKGLQMVSTEISILGNVAVLYQVRRAISSYEL